MLAIISVLSLAFAFFYLIVCFTRFPNILAKFFLVTHSKKKAEAIAVLSGGVYPDGNLSWFSMERLLYGLRLFREGYAQKIILSGGKSSNDKSDAYNMMVFSQELGFKKGIFVLEENSNDTYENLKNIIRIMKRKKFRRVLVVSSSVHMRRVSLLAEKLSNLEGVELIPVAVPFYDHHRKVISDRLVLFHYTLREALALTLYKMKGFI